jgi:hypothetical protein
MRTKKAQISQLQPIIIALVSVGLILAIGFLIMAEVKVQGGAVEDIDYDNVTECATSAACNGTRDTIDAMADIPGWLPIIVITVIGSLLLGLVAFFRGR